MVSNIAGAPWRLAAVAVLAFSPAAFAQPPPDSNITTTSSSAAPTPTSPPPVVTPVFNSGLGQYGLVGCYGEPSGARALPTEFYSPNMTVALCISQAASANATYASVEYGDECWYGDHVHGGSSKAQLADCSFPCPANATEYCGGSNRLLLYSVGSVVPPLDSDPPTQPATIGNYTWVSCMTEGAGVRALSDASFVSDSMTLDSCAAFCSAYKFFGVEYSRECYCGNIFNTGSVAVPATDCSMVCAGAGKEFCGAGNRLSAYGRLP